MSVKDEIKKLIPVELQEKLKPFLAKFSAENLAQLAAQPAVPAPVVASAPIDVKLKDGSTLQVDKMEVGGVANLITPDGSSPAPDGDHEAEDGSVISVAGGVITAIKPAAAPAAVAPSNDMPAMMAAMSARLEALENQNKTLQTNFEAVNAELLDVKKAAGLTLEAYNLMLSAPAGTPVEFENMTRVEKQEHEMTNYEKAKFKRGEKIYKYV